MKEEIRILVADDDPRKSKPLIENIITYKDFENRHIKVDNAENVESAMDFLDNTEKTNQFYDIALIDIDFSEIGGKRDDGYRIIEHASQICPLTKIAAFSEKHDDEDLLGGYDDLRNRNKIITTLKPKKIDRNLTYEQFVHNRLKGIIDLVDKDELNFELWSNHRAVDQFLLSYNSETTSFIRDVIKPNLDGCIGLIKNLPFVAEQVIMFNLLVHLYHQSLEKYCRGVKSKDEIMTTSTKNIQIIKKYYKRPLNFKPSTEEFKENPNLEPFSQRVFGAFTNNEECSFLLQYNYVRNQAVHLKRRKIYFDDILYGNLLLTMIVAGKVNTNIKSVIKYIESTPSKTESRKDLLELVSYLHKQ